MGTSSQAALEALEVQLGGANLNSDTYLVLGTAHGVSHQDHKNEKVQTRRPSHRAPNTFPALFSKAHAQSHGIRAPGD